MICLKQTTLPQVLIGLYILCPNDDGNTIAMLDFFSCVVNLRYFENETWHMIQVFPYILRKVILQKQSKQKVLPQ